MKWLRIASPDYFKSRATSHIFEMKVFSKRRTQKCVVEKSAAPDVFKRMSTIVTKDEVGSGKFLKSDTKFI